MWPTTSRHERGYGTEWDKLRKRVLERDAHLCQCSYCKADGRTTVATEVDHILPKAKGGTDAMSNLQAINKQCHVRKTAEDEHKRMSVRIGIDGYPIV